jgi:hemerythrin-like metal-binding protein
MFQWTNDLAVGIPKIDRDHQELFKMLTEIETVTDIDEQAIYLNRFIEYAASHFRLEEKVMTDYHYDLCKSHREKHEEITTKLADLFEKQVRGGAEAIPHEDLVKLIKFWFFEHTLKVDSCFRDLASRESVFSL